MPKTVVRTKVFIKDMESILNCSVSQTYTRSAGSDAAPDKEGVGTASTPQMGDRARAKKAATEKFAVTAGDIVGIRLKPTQTRVMDPARRAPVNQSPICADCAAQKGRLKTRQAS